MPHPCSHAQHCYHLRYLGHHLRNVPCYTRLRNFFFFLKYTPSHWVTRSVCFHEGGTTINLSQSYLHSPITCYGTVALDLSPFLFLTPGKWIHGKEPQPWLSLRINVFCCWEHQYPWGKHYLLEFVMRYSTGMDDLLCFPGWGRASLSLLGLHCPAAAELVQTHCYLSGSHTIEMGERWGSLSGITCSQSISSLGQPLCTTSSSS